MGDEDLVKEKLELVTEQIFSVLYHEGDMELGELKKRIKDRCPRAGLRYGARRPGSERRHSTHSQWRLSYRTQDRSCSSGVAFSRQLEKR
jgi:hypothetical protein